MVFKAENFIKESVKNLKAYSVNEISRNITIKLDANESNYTLPGKISNNYLKFIRETLINLYPDSACVSLNDSLQNFFGIPSSNFILGNGSDELILTILLSLNKDVTVNIPEPSFSMYKIIAAYNDLKVKEIKLDRDNFGLPDSLNKTLSGRNIYFFSCPNNPTGNYFNPNTINGLLENPDNIIVIDEAYMDFSGRKTYINLISKYENLVVLRTFSKIGMAGLRFGMLFAGNSLIKEYKKIKLPFNVNSLTLKSMEFFINNFDFFERNIAKTIKQREKVYKELSRFDFIKAYPTEANFIFIRLKNQMLANDLDEFLKKNGIIIRSFEGSLKGFFRISIGLPFENTALIRSLKLFDKDLKNNKIK